jgi:hypothetical protein
MINSSNVNPATCIAYCVLAQGSSAKSLKSKKKKCLPKVVIPGIPRLHAATTGPPRIGNYIASRHFRRSRARAGVGAFNIGLYQSRSEDRE